MKKALLLCAIVFSFTQLWSQNAAKTANDMSSNEDRNFRIPLIGEKAPSFTAESTNGTINFPDDFGHNWKVLFSHPKDFTPVCSTEIMELAALQDQFNKLGVKLVVVSTDRLETHVQWKKALENVKLENRDLVKINFPLVDDEKITIAKEYGMIHPETNSTQSVRGVFIIDPNNTIQAILFYPMNLGRSTDELLRMVTALQTSARDKVLMPVNWTAGKDVMVKVPPKKIDSNGQSSDIAGYYNPAWFLWYKKSN
jgi:peroxiredoxin (alkyl hydroperoxide reductase subunit C)